MKTKKTTKPATVNARAEALKAKLGTLLDTASRARNEAVQLTDLAVFLGIAKAAPYQWAKRSIPNSKTAVGLALFEACNGDADRLSSQMRQRVTDLAQQWLATCGHNLDGQTAEALLDEWLSGLGKTLLSPLPELSQPQSEEQPLVNFAQAYHDLYRQAVRRPDRAVQWQLTLNRLSQVDATAETSRWLEHCERGRAAFFSADQAGLPTSLEKAQAMFWPIAAMVENDHVEKCEVFIDPIKFENLDSIAATLASHHSSLASALADKCSFWLRTKADPSNTAPLCVWAFTDIRVRGCFGRLLIPIADNRTEFMEELGLLDDYISGGKQGTGQDQLWRFHSAPLSLEHAVQQLRQQRIHYDVKLREFKPLDLEDWRKL